MKKNILLTLIALATITGCSSTLKSEATTNNSKKFTEEDCKKMLGLKLYTRMNELYGSPNGAMVQCLIRLEDKRKK